MTTRDPSATPQRRATGRQGAVIVLGSSLTIVGSVMVAPVLPKIGAEFGPTVAQADTLVPLVAAGPALAIALFAPIAGWLVDHLGRKAMLIAATVLYALLGAAPSMMHDLYQILAVRLLFGCAEATIMTCCTTLIGDYWSGPDRARYVGRQVVVIGITGALFFLIGGIAGEASWRTPFLLYLLPLLLVPAMALVLWEPKRVRHAHGEQRPEPFDRAALRTLTVAYVLIFLGMVISFVVPVQSPAIVVGVGVTSTTLIGACAGLGMLSTLAGSAVWPVLRRRLGTPRVNAFLLTCMAVGLWILSRADQYEVILVAVAIHGFGGGLLVPNAVVPLLETLPEKTRGRGIGGFTSCLYLGQFASPIIVGAVAAPAHGLLPAVLVFSIATLVLAATWLVVSLRQSGGAQSEAVLESGESSP